MFSELYLGVRSLGHERVRTEGGPPARRHFPPLPLATFGRRPRPNGGVVRLTIRRRPVTKATLHPLTGRDARQDADHSFATSLSAFQN